MKDASFTRRHFEMVGDIINTMNLHNISALSAPEYEALMRQYIAQQFASAFRDASNGFMEEMFINHALRNDLRAAAKKRINQEKLKLTLPAQTVS